MEGTTPVVVGEQHLTALDPERAGGAGDDGLARAREGGTALLDHADRPRREPEVHDEGVVGVTARGIDDRGRRVDRLELAEPQAHHVDGVRAGCTEPAAPRRCVEVPGGHADRGVREQRDEVDDRHEAGLTDRAGSDRAPDRDALGEPAQLVAERVRDTGPPRGGEDGRGLRCVERERLLADHVAPGVEGLEGERCVRRRRARDRDHVDAR